MSTQKDNKPLRIFVWCVLGIDFLVSAWMAVSTAIAAHQVAVLAGTPSGQAWVVAAFAGFWNFCICFAVAGVFIAIFSALLIFLLAWLLGVNPKSPPKK